MRYLILQLVQLLQLTTLVVAGTGGNWTKPNSLSPSFTDTYTVGERIFVSWLNLNDSLSDLWLTRYDTSLSKFALRLLVARNISYPGSYEWTIAVDAAEIGDDTRFLLQFLPTGSAYDPTRIPQLPSPAFNLILLNQLTPPNGTVGAPSITPIATSAASTSSTASSTNHSLQPTGTSTESNAPFSRSVTIGIAIGAGVLALGSIVGAFFIIRSHRRPAPPESIISEEFKAFGPYEVLGTSRQPTELSSKETMVHECESPISVFEMGNTWKKPGVHELPG